MNTLYDSTRPVKPARSSEAGLSHTRAERRAPYSAADLQWWAENSPTNADGYEVVGPADSVLEQLAEEATCQARYEAGVPF